ncbi:barstar family protein [Micromonospora sp. 15K316]|uniref:barstar family protein n=1 Tax=Micromonospora sp. 15K316 TaxID=2530376 RepID=UPI00210FB8A7|nr:barstar family protein [Micromonospora sp. 15K316]
MLYSPDFRSSWLHVVQTAWFEPGRLATRYESTPVVTLSAQNMPDQDAFYCALGEAMNGPGGYFGANLDAVVDCLRSSRRDSTLPRRMLWKGFSMSRTLLGEEFVDSVVGLMQEFGVDVLPQ